MALECDFQALTLVEGWELMRAYEAWGQKTLRGWGRLRVLKPPTPLSEKTPMGIDVSPYCLEKGAKSDKWASRRHQKPLDRNNSCLGPQGPFGTEVSVHPVTTQKTVTWTPLR